MFQSSAFNRFQEDYGGGEPGPGPVHRPQANNHKSREIKVQRRTKTETSRDERSDRGHRPDMNTGYAERSATGHRSGVDRGYAEISDRGHAPEFDRGYVERSDRGQRHDIDRGYAERSATGHRSNFDRGYAERPDRGHRSDLDRNYSEDMTDASGRGHPSSGYVQGNRERREHTGTTDHTGSSKRNGSRNSSTREVNDHLEELDPINQTGSTQRVKGGKKFLRKVQHELEEQRQEWKDEVEKLTQSTLPRSVPKGARMQGTNSFVDTSTGSPIFHAYVDVSEFSPQSIHIEYDELTNRLIVQGKSSSGLGTMTKTFTQKVQLPRFCDSERLSTGLSKRGILKVDVPLLYYFPEQDHQGRDVKSFVNEVREARDGSKVMEILVNTGPGVGASDLRVQVTDDNVLFITAASSGVNGLGKDKLIKRYTLPESADVDRIKSKMGKDGRLVVLVPLRQR